MAFAFAGVGGRDRVTRPPPNAGRAVLGMFLWEYGPCFDNPYLWWNPYNEIDIEYSRWGIPGNATGQFVAQPPDPGNIYRFQLAFTDTSIVSTPNPFRSQTRVQFSTASAGAVTLSVHDLAGRLVRRLVATPQAQGAHEVMWDRHDQAGRSVAPGLYLYRLATPEGSSTGRVVVLDRLRGARRALSVS